MAQENRENSVLFSLRELRDLEHTRVQEEEDTRKRTEAERIQAQQDAERRILEEEEARRRAIEEEERQRQEMIERQRREEEMRLEEADRRARIEAEALLEQQRLVQEAELRRREIEKKRPTWLVALTVGLVLAVGGVGVWGYQTYQERQVIAEQKRQKDIESEEQRMQLEKLQAEIAALNSEIEETKEAVAAAQSEEERRKAQQKLDNLRDRKSQAAAARSRRGGGGKKDKDEPKSRAIKLDPKCLENPLGC